MRRSVFAIALLALASACAGAQSSRPLVVLVHGRGHLEDDTAALRREWKRDLDTALARAGMATLHDRDVRLAWYADALDPARDAGCPRAASGVESMGFGQFAQYFLSSLAGTLPASREGRDLRVILGDMLYAVDPSRRCGAQSRVRATLDSAVREHRPVVVVAYSLGSVVAHAALTGMPADNTVRLRLITIGSPLGNPELRSILGEDLPARVPAAVSGWENLYDPDDGFAGPLGTGVEGVRDVELRSGAVRDPHHVSRYLRDPAVGGAVGRALCALTPPGSPACSAVRAVPGTRASS